MDEFGLIKAFFSRHSPGGNVSLSVGDDAAVVSVAADAELVMTMDTLVAGRHFPEDLPAEQIGWRSLAVNLSDLAAMGADPSWCLLSLSLPDLDQDWLSAFAEGFFSLAEQYQVRLVGGDTVRGPLSVTVQASGQVPAGGALRRQGARPGDRICLGGRPGRAAAGLQQWQDGVRSGELVEAFCKPQPQLALGRKLRPVASACIDVSDGVLVDLLHILDASGGLGADLDLVVLEQDPVLAGVPTEQRLQWQLSGGDDYLLLFTVPAVFNLPHGCVELGRVSARPGLRGRDGEGQIRTLAPAGFNHFPTGD